MNKRLLSVFLCIVLVLSLSVFAYAEESITLHIANSEASKTEPYLEGEDITNNWWTKQAKERYNIDVITDWSTNDSEAYNTKINLAMVSGDLPEAFTVGSLIQLEQLMDAGLLLDVTEVFDTYASGLLKSLVAMDEATWNTGIRDGKLYGIAQMHYDWETQPNYLWLRDDWMKEQGLEAPKTIEELEALMDTFIGAYGGYGLAIGKSLSELYSLAPAWGAYPTIWITDAEGHMEPGAIQPEMKDALAVFANWFAKGYLDPNFTTYDSSAMNSGMVNGTEGATIYPQWWGYNPGADVIKEQGEDAIFYPYELPNATHEVLYPVVFDNKGYTVMSKNCQHPEAVIEMMNFYASVYYDNGEVDEGIQWFRDASLNDYAHIGGPFITTSAQSEINNLLQVSDAIANNDTSYLVSATAQMKYTGAQRWINDKDAVGGLGDYLQHAAGEHAAFRVGYNIFQDKRYILNSIWGKQPELMNSYGSTLDDLLLEGFTKIIIGEEPVEYFDTLIENWRGAGGDAVIDAVNEMYAK